LVKEIEGIKCLKFDKNKIQKEKNFIVMTKWNQFNAMTNINFKSKIKILDFRRFFKKSDFKNKNIELTSIGMSSLN